MSEAIITFKNVSKTYILYKNDQARFKALFFKPRNPKTNKALNGRCSSSREIPKPTKRSTTFPLKSTAANPSASSATTAQVNPPCSK